MLFHPKKIFCRMMSLSLLAIVAFTALLYGGFPSWAATAPSLGTAETFGVLGASAVTNTGASVINGDLGVWPGTSITGFPPGSITGTEHATDAVAQQAQSDVTTAYNVLAGQACDTNLTGQDLGGLTLTPGVYCFDSSAQLTGTLTLNAQGNPNAVWVFQIPSTLTTASNSSVVFTDGLESCYVFWQVGSSATLGTGTQFVGNILAYTSITLTTGASLKGRALARNGAVTMDDNTVTLCILPASAKLGLLKTVDNTGGGTATPGQFTLTATGDASTGPTIVTGTTPVTPANVPVGVYTITETGPTGYTPVFSVSGGGTLVGNKLTITSADAGKTITVTILNTYAPLASAKLGLLKTVDNTGGGTATAGQFTLTATGDGSTGPTIITGTTPVTAVNVPVGVYTITETGPAGYTRTFSVSGGGTLVGNKLTITSADAGKTITVTILNTYAPEPIPTLSEWGMIIFMVFLGLTSIYYLRRRQEGKA